MAGLGAMLGHQRNRKRLRSCERCSLLRPQADTACPHCDSLDDAGLQALQARLDAQHRANVRLGRWLGVAAAALLLLTVLVNMLP